MEALFNAYEKWKNTPEGKERLAKVDTFKCIEINDLPLGWSLADSDKSGEYFIYSNNDENDTITVELVPSGPVHFGGTYSCQVRVKEEPDDFANEDEDSLEIEEEERVIFDESVEENCGEVVKEANQKTLEYMRKV